jgi:CubicO group peptidase (beta-lactamase class C family)
MIKKLKSRLFITHIFLLGIILNLVSCYTNDTDQILSPGSNPAWQTSAPEKQNVSSTVLLELLSHLDNNEFGNIKSLLIVRNNYLIFEKYFNGADQNQLHILYSVTKSITSIVTGIAINNENNFNVNDKIENYFPAYESDFDSLKNLITIKEVLTMTAGFQWNELSIPYSDPQNDFNKLYTSNDRINFLLQKEIVNTPGTVFTYNTGLPLLQSAILKQSCNISVADYAELNLFNPLGIVSWSWGTNSDSITNTGNGLALRPTDLAIIGQLLLNGGSWNGQQVISQDWITESTQKSVTDNSLYDYGYFWWRFSDQNPVVASLPVNDLYFAWGYSDQFLFVIPVYNMLVVITADNQENNYPIFNILKDYIFTAVED